MKILLVEDSEEVSCITVEYLHELGHEAVAVTDAEQAMTRIADTHFDAVMTDVRLPGMSGIDLARELSQRMPRLPVVIASGYGSLSAELLRGGKLNNVLTLPKPYDLEQLETTLCEAALIATRS
jgi:CheY-like chemotaxis protein